MAFKYGSSSSVGVGEESTYGTAVTPTEFIEFTSESMQVRHEKRPAAGINTTMAHKKMLTLGSSVVGDVAFEVNPDDFLPLILKAWMGQAPTSAQQGTTSAYKHTFKGANDWIADGNAGCGLTLQINRDGECVDYSGCLPNVINLSAAVGDALKANASFMGQQAAAQGSATSPSFSTLNPFVFHQGSITREASGIDVINFNLNLDHGARADTHILGQTYPKRPACGMRSITGSVEMYFEDTNIYDAFTANTNNALVLTFTGDTISGAYSYEVVVTLGKLYWLDNPTPNVNSADVLTYTAPFQAIWDDATDQDIKVEWTNTTTSY